MNDMLTPGKILKYYRIKKGFSLSDIASATRIPIDQLTQIEADQYTDPDAEVFYKGFIKNYSDHLNLDTEKILAIFRRTVAAKPATTPVIKEDKKQIVIDKVNSSEIVKNGTQPKAITTPASIIAKAKSYIKNLQLTPSFIATLIAAIVLIAVATYLIIQFNNYRKTPQVTISSPDDNYITNESFVTIVGSTTPKTIIEINDQIVQIDTEGNFTYEIQLTEGVNQVNVKAKRNEKDEGTTITRTVVYEKPFVPVEDDEEEEETAPQTPVITEHDLSISMTEDVWIKLTIDSNSPINTLLKAGDTKEYTWKDSFTVSIGKPKTTKITVDGEEKEIIANMQTGVGRVSCTSDNGTVSCK